MIKNVSYAGHFFVSQRRPCISSLSWKYELIIWIASVNVQPECKWRWNTSIVSIPKHIVYHSKEPDSPEICFQKFTQITLKKLRHLFYVTFWFSFTTSSTVKILPRCRKLRFGALTADNAITCGNVVIK